MIGNIKKVIGVIFILSAVSGCAVAEAEEISSEKEYSNIVDLSSNIDTEESALNLAIDVAEVLFEADRNSLEGEVSYNQNSTIQPDGWFVQMQDNNWDYAVWIREDENRIKLTRAKEDYPMTAISEEEMEKIVQDTEWIDSAKEVVMNKLGDSRAIEDIYFENENAECNSIDITLILEDGAQYLVSFYKDKVLRSLLYFK